MAEDTSLQGQSLVAFQYPDFGLYQLARLFTVMATEMQSVAVGWQVFEITRRPLDLGLVGQNCASPTKPRSSGRRVISKTCQPTATDCISVAITVNSRAS